MDIIDIKVSVGITHNMGNYESLRLDYGITVKPRTSESWEKAIDLARAACNLKLTQDLEHQIEWLTKVENVIHGH